MAIDVKTLRAGNKVMDSNGVEFILTGIFSSSSDDLFGIPISPSTLNRLRFREDPNDNSWTRYGPSLLKILRDPSGFYYVAGYPNGKLHYTHQLQNLIYDLTGEVTQEFDEGSLLGSVLSKRK